MTHPPYWMEASLERPIPGCNRLQICGLFARFSRDLQSYLVDIVDVAMSPVQFGVIVGPSMFIAHDVLRMH